MNTNYLASREWIGKVRSVNFIYLSINRHVCNINGSFDYICERDPSCFKDCPEVFHYLVGLFLNSSFDKFSLWSKVNLTGCEYQIAIGNRLGKWASSFRSVGGFDFYFHSLNLLRNLCIYKTNLYNIVNVISLKTLISQAKNIDFHKTVDRPITPFHTDLLVLPIVDQKFYSQVIDAPFSYKNEVCISGAFYDDFKFLDDEEEIIHQKLQKDSQYLDKKAEEAEKAGEELIRFCQTAGRRPDFIKEYITKAARFVPWFTFTISVGNYLEKRIEKALVEKFGEEEVKAKAIVITSPTRLNQHSLEQDAFLKLAQKHTSGAKTDGLIKDHLEKYGHIGFRDGEGAVWTREDILQRLKACQDPLAEQKRIVEARQQKIVEARQILLSLKLDKELMALIATAQRYVWLRTYRSDVYSQAFALMAPTLEVYAGQNYLSFIVDDFLKKRRPTKRELGERAKCFAAIGIHGRVSYLASDDALSFKKFLEAKVDFGEEIKGIVASKQILTVSGAVKIVNSPRDLKKVEQGDIIVSPMTTPNFTSAMKIAAGFITDEGGILCHAAILGRELGKPCIVGTRNATRVLKDFDLVKMDLKTGEVKKLS
jgi:phosphohistidine swiveling domain-containing protein